MKRVLLAAILAAAGAVIPLSPRGEETAAVKLTWLGHACFLLASPMGTTVLLDPYNAGTGYKVKPVTVDAVVISHEHFDHNNPAMAPGAKKVIRGLTSDGDWAKVEETAGEVKIRTVGVYHDESEGRKRGKNAVLILETAGKTIVHLGDLGHELNPDQIKEIGRVDVLLIPVGGTYTLDAQGAKKVIDQLNPKIVIPMHYKTGKGKIGIDPVDDFIKLMPGAEKRESAELVITHLPEQMQVIVLTPAQ